MDAEMRRAQAALEIALVCFVLGLLIVLQLRSTSRAATLLGRTSDQSLVLATLVDANAGLRNEIAELEAQLALLNQANREQSDAALIAELNRLFVVSGTNAASGPGVRINVSGQINPLDMQDLINELRNAGAEAMDLNGRRLVARSVVARDGNDLVLDDVRLTAPYLLQAIGNSDTLEKALLRHGGLVSLLEYAYPGLTITVSKADGLTLSARPVIQYFKFAQAIP
jgi:uncharacterized protein YlxW (UPF0749 family)